MAATIITEPLVKRKTKVCFSLAAYAKDLIAHLHRHSDVPIDYGLTQTELSAIESSFNFSFPPDLRSILREGLPVGQGFPNWRSSSPQQLDILVNLPILGLCKEVYRKNFWHHQWGDRPEEDDEAVRLAKGFLKKAPVLVPVYRNCYISSVPCLAGNPIFYVNGLDFKLWSYDVIGFIQQMEFKEGVLIRPKRSLGQILSAPVWAATEDRTIEFWTELLHMKLRRETPETEKKWWNGSELGRCLEDVRLKLIDGGWKEKDVDEMMMMMEMNPDEKSPSSSPSSPSPSSLSSWSSSSDDDGGGVNKAVEVRDDDDRVAVGWHVRALSQRLLRAGWSTGDVMESLGCLTKEKDRTTDIEIECGGGDFLFDFEHNTYICIEEGQSASLGPVMKKSY